MTLILTELTPWGIAMAADTALTVRQGGISDVKYSAVIIVIGASFVAPRLHPRAPSFDNKPKVQQRTTSYEGSASFTSRPG